MSVHGDVDTVSKSLVIQNPTRNPIIIEITNSPAQYLSEECKLSQLEGKGMRLPLKGPSNWMAVFEQTPSFIAFKYLLIVSLRLEIDFCFEARSPMPQCVVAQLIHFTYIYKAPGAQSCWKTALGTVPSFGTSVCKQGKTLPSDAPSPTMSGHRDIPLQWIPICKGGKKKKAQI